MSNESCTAIQARRDEILFLVFGDKENHLSNVPFWSNSGPFWFNPGNEHIIHRINND